MHESVYAWVGRQPMELRSLSPILEIGSCNVNGSVRDLLNPVGYVGVDIAAGDGVDLIVPGHQLPFPDESFPLVVSTEMLEHAPWPRLVLAEMHRVLIPGGRLLLTARGPGFQYHNPPDYWRFTVEYLDDLLFEAGFSYRDIEPDPQVPGVFAKAVR